ncbi:MAG: tripartite tricarboxylate transporter TctB family protein [Pyramidobacter sp.]|nr:tripartite tricarboxylate transporter TctB family protein [Pyramidobacter sp.]
MNGFLSRDRLISLFCFAFAGYIWYEAGTFPTSDFDAVGPSLYPRFLATVIGLAALVIFLRPSQDEAGKGTKAHWGSFLYVILVSAAYIALLMPLGFIPTTVLFLLAMVLYFEPSELKVRVRKAAIYAVLFSAFLYLFFGKVLGVLLPKGILAAFIK